jgi:hypothetical protein
MGGMGNGTPLPVVFLPGAKLTSAAHTLVRAHDAVGGRGHAKRRGTRATHAHPSR